MTIIHTNTYTISIPAPILPGELEQLAQIQVPGGKLVVVYWMRSTRQAVCNYDGKWYIQSDQNIMSAIAQLIKFNKNIELLTMDGLFIFETRGHGYAAEDEFVQAFRDCEWSDYASDCLVFQCVIREKNNNNVAKNVAKNVANNKIDDINIITKYTAEKMVQNNQIKYNIPIPEKTYVDNRIRASPPVLMRATECCCSGCHKVVEVKKNVDKNHKW